MAYANGFPQMSASIAKYNDVTQLTSETGSNELRNEV